MTLTPEEINYLREGGRRLVLVLERLRQEIKPGTNLRLLAKLAETEAKRQGGLPSFQGFEGYPAPVCLCVNDQVVHCLPRDIQLKDGDIITVDMGLYYQGLHTDAAVTWTVGRVSPSVTRLLDGAYAALLAGTNEVRAGAKVSSISRAIEKTLTARGLTIFRQFVGHGVGRKLHESPMIPNFVDRGQDPTLTSAMAIAIEPITGLGTDEVITEADGWSTRTADGRPAAEFEHTVLVTPTGYEVITPLETLIGSH
ncbi:TPA: type I methionyl aminopeptidase [Patescibacteria group bacterium]|uniref:Methionine aminopeptidase n=2 Tax=Bacteria division Kazan-3B-28 TaxID=1798534 RepID=A0A0G1X7C8_UNCK3|nr:MAG: methionine aminopeptidase [candidate division Kazan bacterium GW2011_GWA1_50_15]KKW25419.1 MAG: Methionine aminopeptidase [candidate division Kazan bacterium GW2011_GWC1_52_13]KKW26725.1 MAG: Methionine aminopeptidase [candidate division Kazan bacterium GW2011_GWB1_52_7]HAV65722.1 type I methionyl aminopeptidase [Patescibacteria group bacterium]HCL47584.1 type I methionyl aminopeptidase [Patescibacteria group bacterium]